MTNKLTPNSIKQKLQNWLMADGWGIREESGPATIWAFIAEDRLQRKIVVGQNSNREDEVIVQGSVTIEEAITKKLEALPEEEREEFLWNLRFELLRTDLEFQGIESPLKKIEVSERLFIDALTKDNFMQRVSQVRKGVLMVLWILMKKFSKRPPAKQLGFQR